jgi:DNA-binding CsgD family transcriptional regulator
MRTPLWITIPGVDPHAWSFPVGEGRLLIGRAPVNHLRLVHRSVSRVHAQLERQGDQLTLRDLGSRYGTFVNGERIAEVRVQPGQELRLGGVTLELRDGSGDDVPSDTSMHATGRLAHVPPTFLERLTTAQRRVFDLVLAGHAEKRIADFLFLSPHTIHAHLKVIYKIFDVHSRAALLAHCLVDRSEKARSENAPGYPEQGIPAR